MKDFKILMIISLLIIFATLTNCGRNGSREAYPNYPKEYPYVKNNL